MECGLGTDELLVTMDPRRLKDRVLVGRAARHPTTGSPAAVVSDLGAAELRES